VNLSPLVDTTLLNNIVATSMLVVGVATACYENIIFLVYCHAIFGEYGNGAGIKSFADSTGHFAMHIDFSISLGQYGISIIM